VTTQAGRAIFLDRDGTINVEKGYLYRHEDWEWIPGAVDAIRRLNELGYLVIVVTNQAGVARGFYGDEEVLSLHDKVHAELFRAGARIDDFFYCPHHPEYGGRVSCQCRKPKPGMLLRAAERHRIDPRRSYLIGDRESDMEAAQAAGVRPLLVATGYGQRTREECAPEAAFFPSIVEAVAFIAAGGSLAVETEQSFNRNFAHAASRERS
jgi:D-glycero-D-manno-heptose 1,7-bisphosphate phosphatase